MAELRYNQLLGDYVMIASHRQDRPQMPKDYCPFCPGSGKVPDSYDVYKYDNDFPALFFRRPIESHENQPAPASQIKRTMTNVMALFYKPSIS